MPVSMSFADKLRAAMEAQGINQSELSRRLGISSQAVNQWLREGGTAPRGSRLQEIAGVLGVTVSELLGEQELPAPAENLQRAELISAFASADEHGRELLLRLARSLKSEAPSGPKRPDTSGQRGCVVAMRGR